MNCLLRIKIICLGLFLFSPIFANSRLSCGRFSVEPTGFFSFLSPTGIVVTEFGSGSGFLIGRDVMVTSAHNLIKMNGQQSKVIYFFPSSLALQYGKELPGTRGFRGQAILIGEYLKNPFSEDWACIKLERPVNRQMGYFNAAKTPYQRGQNMYVGGFQDNCSTQERNHLVFSGCRTEVEVNLNLKQNPHFKSFPMDTSGITTFYGCPLSPGASGSPAINTDHEVIGVVSIGEASPGTIPTGAFVNVSKFKKCFELAEQ